MEELIRLSEAAERLGVHITTLRGWVAEGRVPSYRLGERYVRVRWNEVLVALSCTRGTEHQGGPSAQAGEAL
jgi:excisionase family DNA binding protein